MLIYSSMEIVKLCRHVIGEGVTIGSATKLMGA